MSETVEPGEPVERRLYTFGGASRGNPPANSGDAARNLYARSPSSSSVSPGVFRAPHRVNIGINLFQKVLSETAWFALRIFLHCTYLLHSSAHCRVIMKHVTAQHSLCGTKFSLISPIAGECRSPLFFYGVHAAIRGLADSRPMDNESPTDEGIAGALGFIGGRGCGDGKVKSFLRPLTNLMAGLLYKLAHRVL